MLDRRRRPVRGAYLPVPCGSSAGGVVYEGAVYHPAPGYAFPSGGAPDCTREGTMLLTPAGRLDVYAPDGEHTALVPYTGPRPTQPCA